MTRVPWWNRMSRRGIVIEGVDYATNAVNLDGVGGFIFGPWYILERVRMPGDPPPMTFKVTSITYPKKR